MEWRLSGADLLIDGFPAQNHDYPEDFLTYKRISLEAGFSAVDKLAVDSSELMAAIALRA